MTTGAPPEASTGFRIDADKRAREWLAQRPETSPVVVAFSVARCCGGSKVCDVQVHLDASPRDKRTYAHIGTLEGRDLLVDTRITNMLPRHIPITVRGIARKRLWLDLSGEEWGRLLWGDPA